MLKTFSRIFAWGCVSFLVIPQSAEAQYRGGYGRSGSYGGRDSRSSDGDREEMRRRYFEAMRARMSSGGSDRGGDFRSRFGGSGGSPWGGDSRSRFGGSDRGGDSRSRFGGFPGFDRGRDNDDDRNRSDRGRDDDRSRYSRSRGDDRDRRDDRSGSSAYVPKPHDPIAVAMPGNYAEGDTDGDGQIALLEWRQWRPQDVKDFMTMDANQDGFLTARELIIHENSPQQTTVASSNSGGDNNSSSAASSRYESTPSRDDNGNQSGEKASAAEARYVFKALDRSRDGKISEDEWRRSRSVRQGFEKEGIKLDFPIDEKRFFEKYPPYRIVPQLRLPD